MKSESEDNQPTSRKTEQSTRISRRSFITTCTMAAAATGLPIWFVERELAAAASQAKPLSPNDRPGIALIGCGGQGTGDASNALRFGEVIAVCDVDTIHIDKAVEKFTKEGKTPARYSDFRKVLERDDVHVVINGTPDHWHTLINLAAAKARKDVYGEKPLTLTIDEGKPLVRAVRDSKIVLQTGTQQRSSQRFRMACEAIRNGRIGKLKEVTVWLPAGLREGPFQSKSVPAELNWDFWLGQAPKVDYVPERCHRMFRYWYDYSGGTMTDWGAHHIDIAFWAIGGTGPTAVEGEVLAPPIPGGYTAISEYEVRFMFPGDILVRVRTTRDDNGFGGIINKEGQRNGLRFEGSDGWIWVNRDEIKASDIALVRTPLPENAERLYSSNDHMSNFFDCVRSRKDPISDVEVGHRSASLCHLGAIALRTGLKLRWDAAKQEFLGDNAKAANAMVSREMRKPYDYSFAG
jgi:predicted dehydrogenase